MIFGDRRVSGAVYGFNDLCLFNRMDVQCARIIGAIFLGVPFCALTGCGVGFQVIFQGRYVAFLF